MTCRTCHRPLTAKVSLARGYGPECDPDPEERRRVAEVMRPKRERAPTRPRGRRAAAVQQMGLFERVLLAEIDAAATGAPEAAARNDCDEIDDEARIAGAGCSECPGGCGVW